MKYIKASFNDIHFYVEKVSMSGGHNLRIYEYPGDELGQSKHLSIKLKKYSVDAYLIGENVKRQRDALISVLDDTSIGTLKHPTYGEFDCHAESYTIDENIGTEARIVKISINFIPSGSEDFFQAVKGYVTEIGAFRDLVIAKIGAYRAKLGLITKPTGFSLQSIAILMKYLNKKEVQVSKTSNSDTIRKFNNTKKNLSTLILNPVTISEDIGELSTDISNDIVDLSNKIDLQRQSKRALSSLTEFNNQTGNASELFYYNFFGSALSCIDAANLSNQIAIDGVTDIKASKELQDFLSNYLSDLSDTLYSLQANAESLYPDVFYSNEFDDIESTITDLRNANFRLFNSYLNYTTYEANSESIINIAFKNYKTIEEGIIKIESYNRIKDYSNIRGSILIP